MPENYTYDIACSGLAASGAVSSAISSITTGVCGAKINSKEWTVAITVAAGALSGGITAKIAGGDFWEGVCNGLISSGLNHAMHLVAEGGSPDDPPGKGRTTSKSNAQKNIDEAETAVGGTATLIGGAAKMVDGMEKLEEGLTHFGRTLFGINFISIMFPRIESMS